MPIHMLASELSTAQLKRLLQIYSRKVSKNPHDLNARLIFAEICRRLGHIDQAIHFYREVALEYGLAGHLSEAILICKFILKLNEKHTETQHLLAEIFSDLRVREAKQAAPVKCVDSNRIAASSPQKLLSTSPSTRRAEVKGDELPLRTLQSENHSHDSSTENGPNQDCDWIAFAPTQNACIDKILKEKVKANDLSPQTGERSHGDDDDPLVVFSGSCDHRSDLHDGPQAASWRKEPAVESTRKHEALLKTHSDSEQFLRETRPYGAPVERQTTEDSASHAPMAAEPIDNPASATPSTRQPDQKTDRFELFQKAEVNQPLDEMFVESVLKMDQYHACIGKQRSLVLNLKEMKEELEQAWTNDDRLPDGWVDADTAETDEAKLIEKMIIKAPRAIDHETGVARLQSAHKHHFPLFSDLEHEAFTALIGRLEWRSISAGEFLFFEGDPGNCLFLIVSGSLQVLKTNDYRETITLATLGPGAFLGEFALLTDRLRHASVRALEDGEVLELGGHIFAELCKLHPSIARTMRSFYQQRLLAMVMATAPIFRAFAPEKRREILSKFFFRRVYKDELIIEEGQKSTGFYIILIGEMKITYKTPDEFDVLVAQLSEGDFFGEISLLTDAASEVSVQASRDSEVLQLNPEEFAELVITYPEIFNQIKRSASQRQRDTSYAKQLTGALHNQTNKPFFLI